MIIGPADGITLRDYQNFCIDGGDPRHGPGILPCLARYKSTLALMATGTGKGSVLLALMRRFLSSPKTPPDALAIALAHRDELVDQPIDQAHRFGLMLAREQGPSTAVGGMARAISGTIQTMISRLHRYDRKSVKLLIIDEAHHACSDTVREIIEYFSDAYLVGFTATADRHDGVGLGEVFKSVAYDYQIETAVENGWLVPPIPRRYIIDGLDLDKLRARGGDLPPEELGQLMAQVSHTVAPALVRHTGEHQAIVFCVTVAHAYAQAESLKRYTSGVVAVADGTTDKDERRQMVRDFRDGKIQYLINAQLWTEGLDTPNATVCAMLRPTLARGFYTQCAGRVLRPLQGVVDAPELRDDPAGRRAAIAASAKPNAYILDFSGVSEKHSLVGPLDALAGRLTPAERLALVSIELVGDQSAVPLIQQARKLAAIEAAREAELVAEAACRSYDVDPFHPVVAMGMKGLRDDPNEARASEKMAKFLARNGVENAAALSASTAKKLQGTIIVRDRLHLASINQSIALQRAGVPTVSTLKMSIIKASALMAELHQNRGVRPRRWDSDPLLGGQTK